MSARKLVFVITEAWFFCSHFLVRAKAAQAAGFEVVVITREDNAAEKIRKENIRVVPLNLGRSAINPIAIVLEIFKLSAIYRREKPDVVHHIAMKPIIAGSAASYLAGIKRIVNAPVGMGFVFSSNSWKARMLRPVFKALLKKVFHLKNGVIILENNDDRQELAAQGLAPKESMVLIEGAGVDAQTFSVGEKNSTQPLIVLASRMLYEKGIEHFVDAAQHIQAKGINARFILVGAPDAGNPTSIPESQLTAWRQTGSIEWWGHSDEMARILAAADIFCLPSYYREGLPKVLLEAAACGCAIVTTDAPGCREIVVDGETGLLVPLHDQDRLIEALEKLILDPSLRLSLGTSARKRVEEKFTDQVVVEKTLDVYRRLYSLSGSASN